MKFVVIGGAGQVGRGLMRALHGMPDVHVAGVTRNTMSAGPLLTEGFEIRVGAVTDPASAPALMAGADVVVNCALEIDRPKRARARNQHLVASLMQHAKASLVVHLSSVAVYGSCVDRTVSTFERPRPDGTYGQEKLRLEHFALREAQSRRQRALILRLGHVYGAGQGISREVCDVVRGRTWALPFDGTLPSNGVHIEHLAAALVRMAGGEYTGVQNATDSPQRTWRDIYDLHAQAMQRPPVDGMDEAESTKRRARFRQRSRQALLTRVASDVAGWTRAAPGSLVMVPSVRQTVESLLLRLPAAAERTVDRRYAVFSAGLHVPAESPADGPPPWYFSDGVAGPGLPDEPETPARTAREIQDLRDWYAVWSAPQWRLRL